VGEGVGAGSLPLLRAVGFADLVGYTEISEKLDVVQLAALVQDFEATTRDIVTSGGGRIVKSIGDAVMFIADDPARGAVIALELAEALGRSCNTPPARVAMVWGRVLARFGDVFGPTVNLSSRLAERSEPGQVLIDERTAIALSDEADLAVVPEEICTLAGIGQVFPYRLVRSESLEG
jgi:adenylate cyclase